MPKPSKEEVATDLLKVFHQHQCWAGDELTRRQLLKHRPWRMDFMTPYVHAQRNGWFLEFERDVGYVVQLTPAGAEKMAELFGRPRKDAIINPVSRFDDGTA